MTKCQLYLALFHCAPTLRVFIFQISWDEAPVAVTRRWRWCLQIIVSFCLNRCFFRLKNLFSVIWLVFVTISLCLNLDDYSTLIFRPTLALLQRIVSSHQICFFYRQPTFISYVERVLDSTWFICYSFILFCFLLNSLLTVKR